MRTVGIIFLSLTPFIIGLDYAKSLKIRRDFFATFKEFVMFVKDQIRFSNRERDEIFSLALMDPRFNTSFFKGLQKTFKTEENATKISNYINDIRLNAKELCVVESFVFGLGKNDLEGQLNHCDYYFSAFEQMANNSAEAYSVKSRLSLGLTLSLALIMFIIMI